MTTVPWSATDDVAALNILRWLTGPKTLGTAVWLIAGVLLLATAKPLATGDTPTMRA